MIYLGADHRGFELKNRLVKRLSNEGYKITNLGSDHLDLNDDYPDFAEKVAEAVISDEGNLGILLCGSGTGVDMVANKVDGIRSALVSEPSLARKAREDDNANVLSLPADLLDEEKAWEIVKTFLQTEFSGEDRHKRRLNKLQEVEESH